MKKIAFFALATMMSASVFAGDIHCNGHLSHQNIDGNVNVTQQCSLINVKVSGNVMLQNNAILTLKNSQIKGNVESKGSFHKITAIHNNIDGNIQLTNGKVISLIQNTVNGDVQLKNNHSSVVVKMNNIDGNLQCENTPTRPVLVSNQVSGNTQCR